MPDTGGSYFTFSNENNDLIWGFLAECHRRGWLYKGHDTMPWCARCGTGLSQMEMNEGYQDREDPGLTVRFPLVDRPGESLLVWTTTPWTLTSNVAAAVGPTLRYVRVRQGDDEFWLGEGDAQDGARRARSRSSRRWPAPTSSAGATPARSTTCRRSGPPSPRAPATTPATPYEHRVVAVDRGRRGRGHRHRPHRARAAAPRTSSSASRSACRSIAPLDECGHLPRRLRLAVGPRRPRRRRADRRAPQARGPVLPARDDHPPLPALLALRDAARLPPRRRVVHQHGPALRPAARDADAGAGRRQPALPDHGRRRPDPVDPGLRLRARARLAPQHARLDDQQEALLGPGAADLRLRGVRDDRGHRRPRGARTSGRSRAGTTFEGHTPHRPYVDAVKIACPGCGGAGRADQRRRQSRGSTPGSCRSRRSTSARTPSTGAQWFPADFITESFPGQFRNWFYSMLAMSTVLRREPPFKTIFGYALVFAEDGRQMHKSWGNAIEFDEAADRMGVDVMRWMFAKARPEENILFGWHAADEARRELLVLWNVYAFFVTYARLAGWTPARGGAAGRRAAGPRPLDPVARGRDRGRGRGRGCATSTRVGATRALSSYLDGLSTWYLRLSRRRFSRSDDPADRAAAFATLHEALVATARMLAPILPFLAEVAVREPRRDGRSPTRPTASTSRRWPSGRPGRPPRRRRSKRAMAVAQGAVDLARTLRSTARLKTRQPLATAWLALPDRGLGDRRGPARLIADEINVKDGRRHRRRLGAGRAAGQAAAAEDRQASRVRDPGGHGRGPRRRGRRSTPDGSVTLAGVTLAPDEVEIQATPRPGTAVAHHDGLVVVLDTELTPGARRRGRRPRARSARSRTCAATPARARRPDRPVGRGRCPTAVARAPRRRSPRHARRPRHRRRRRPDAPPRDGRARRRPGRRSRLRRRVGDG